MRHPIALSLVLAGLACGCEKEDASRFQGYVEGDYLRIAAPAVVEDTYYRVGEWVAPGAPVVSLLPPENRFVRFFVPEAIVAQLKVGQAVQVHRDNAASVAATVTFIAPRAEFTPPVIYSRE